MFTEAKALLGPGRYEGLSAFEAWLCEHVDDCADENSGDVESSTGWFARCGRWVVFTDSQGFWYTTRYATRELASAAFTVLEDEYDQWAGDDEGEE